jgi:hypothetical protein
MRIIYKKVNYFFRKEDPNCALFIFHSKREAIAHGRMATDPVFPLWAPNCHLGEWQFGSFFAEIPRSWNQECPVYKGFRGVGREKSAPLLSQQPPPPYAPEAIASLYQAVYVKTFYLWQLPPCVAADHVTPNHIRGHGVPYDMENPGLHEVGARSWCSDCQLETVMHQTSLTAKRSFPNPCRKSRSCLRSARVK